MRIEMSGISLEQTGSGSLGREHGPEQRPRGEPVIMNAEPQRLAVLTVAADKDYLALARMTAMHVAGLLGLPIGRVTDLRLAVDEACSVFLAGPSGPAAPLLAPRRAATLTLRFERIAGQLRIAVSGPAPLRRPDEDDLGWTMLCALVGEPRWEVLDGVGTLTLTDPIPTGRA
jgi:serine/threonine-protein kinase RsbW